MTSLENKLIEAIEASNVDKTMEYIVENICGSGVVACKLAEMAVNDSLKYQDPALQAIGAMAIKFGKIAIEYKAQRQG